MKHFIFSLFFVHVGFISVAQTPLKKGMWRGTLLLNKEDKEALPFNFNVSYIKDKPVIEIYNAAEKIKVDEVTIKGDSLFFKMPVFDSGFIARIKKDTLTGLWINGAKKENNRIPFVAYFGDTRRFITSAKAAVDFTGKYEVTFDVKQPGEYKAIGLFEQKGDKLIGTFLTETGDYRYFEGNVENSDMKLSCFDGAHAFLFSAHSAKNSGKADSLSGLFKTTGYSENWIAVRNDSFKLKNPESITYLKNPKEIISFSFPNLENQKIQLTDPKFKNKVIIIQIMGSWCPNCMDETAYLAQLYKQYKTKDLEIIALAYERTPDFAKAKNNISRLKTRFGADYEFLITGLTGKAKASESLPFLNSISAFPTTLILNKNHQVESVYTGFSGPATGKEYELYKATMEALLKKLMAQ